MVHCLLPGSSGALFVAWVQWCIEFVSMVYCLFQGLMVRCLLPQSSGALCFFLQDLVVHWLFHGLTEHRVCCQGILALFVARV